MLMKTASCSLHGIGPRAAYSQVHLPRVVLLLFLFLNEIMPHILAADVQLSFLLFPVVRNSSSGLILSQLGVDAMLIYPGSCKPMIETLSQLMARCPHFSMGTLPTGVTCKFSDMCTGMTCCAEIDFGVVKRKFKVWAQIDPCNFLLSVGFEKWNLNVTLIGFTQGKYGYIFVIRVGL
jgi:hypothetical protein